MDKKKIMEFVNECKTSVPKPYNSDDIEISGKLARIPIQNFSILNNTKVPSMMNTQCKSDLGEISEEIAGDMYRVKLKNKDKPDDDITIVFV